MSTTTIKMLSDYALEHNASDIHLSVGQPPFMRIYGDMTKLNLTPLSLNDIMAILNSIMTEQQKTIYAREKDLDFAIEVDKAIRYRVNTFYTLNGPAAVMRFIPTKLKSLQELECPAIFEAFTNYQNGLILVTGPTGCGKSTTLAALIDHINTFQNKHIITIEDPVEFVHEPKKCLIHQREVGNNTKSFSTALRSALREDPDVILLGELRDLETIRMALTAAETGHLIFGTLHTSSAPKAVDRIIDVYPGDEKEMIRAMLANSLKAIITQQLLKKTGKGLIASYEILVATDAVRNLIRENKIPQINSMMQVGLKNGMITMENYARTLLEKGIISKEEMISVMETRERSMESNQDQATKGIKLLSSEDAAFF